VLNISFCSYDVKFVGMVLPGDELTVKLRHIGMRDGNIVVNIETFNAWGENAIQGSAEVSQSRSSLAKVPKNPAWVWTCTIVRLLLVLWEGADAHLAVYGCSIVDIVKDNPKEKMIHFGIKGQAIRQLERYMDMTYYDTMDKDGHVKTLPLFADINVRCPKYTFSRPAGLLFATQFKLLRSHSSSLRRLRLRICVSKASFRKIAHSLDTRSLYLER
jgi:fatty acid synthase subunit alpha, fungi type